MVLLMAAVVLLIIAEVVEMGTELEEVEEVVLVLVLVLEVVSMALELVLTAAS